MRLADLLNEMDRAAASHAKAKPSPEVACATLREVAIRYARKSPFTVGDMIAPCADGDMKRAGEPHVVLEVRDRPAPDFAAKGAEDTVSNAYGRRCDLRVASVVGGDVVPFWVESWQFEPYRGPGSEAPAA